MASQIEETPTFFTIYNKFSATWLSGASREIIAKLPAKDLSTYSKIGYFNLFATLQIAIAAYWLSYIFFNGNIAASIAWSYFMAAVFLVLIRFLTKHLINNTGIATTFLFILLGLIISLVVTAGYSLHSGNVNRIAKEKKSLAIYDSLMLIKDNTDKAFIPLRKSLAYYPLNNISNANIDSLFNGYTNFLHLTTTNLESLTVRDTSNFNLKAYKLQSLTDSLSLLSLLPIGDSNKTVSNKRALQKLYAGPYLAADIAYYFNPLPFETISYDRKIAVLFKYFNVWSYINLFSILLSTLSILFLLFIILKTSNNDFYHQLFLEKRRLDETFLMQQRNKIADDYKFGREVHNTNSSYGPATRSAPSSVRSSAPPYVPKPSLNSYIVGKEPIGKLTPNSLYEAAEITFENFDLSKTLEYLNKAIELEGDELKENKDYRLMPEIYELKARTLKDLDLREDAEIADKKAREIRGEHSFLNNKNKKIALDKLVVQDVSIFDNFIWSFRPGINLLLGKNGYGKSHLLALLIALLYDDKIKIKDWIQGTKATARASLYLTGDVPGKDLEEMLVAFSKDCLEMQTKLDDEIKAFIDIADEEVTDKLIEKKFKRQLKKIEEVNDKIIDIQAKLQEYIPTISADPNTIKTHMGRVPILAIPDSRFIDKSGESILSSTSEYSDIAKYGAHEFLYGIPYMKVIENALFKSCIAYFENGKTFQREPFELIQRVIKDLSSDKLISVNGKMMYQDESRFEFVSIESNEKNGSFSITVRPEDAPITLPIQKVSQGTFSIVAICCLVFNFLSSVQQDEPITLNKYAMVIIDELDAHIHPSWQRKLIPILRKNFPNVQFIISAHSPLLVEGCRANEVSVLRRTIEGKFKIDTINKSMIGFSIENIYSLIFEVENRDFETLRYKELSPYLEDFKRELDQLKLKENTKEQLSEEETSRITELQDLIAHIDISTIAVEKKVLEKQNYAADISDLLRRAAEYDPNNLT